MVRIPVEYQEVEYLESSGTQYIDTGYIPTVLPILKAKIRIVNTMDRDIAGFTSNTFPSFIIDAAPAQSRWYNRYGDTVARNFPIGPPVLGEIQDWEWGKETKLNGDHVYAFDDCDWSSNSQKMNIFKGRNNAAVVVYSCSLYDGELVRNFIPCYRKSDSEPGMYDTVTKQFFTNAGTGTFLVGNDVSWDTASLIERRRQILLNTPHLATASANPLTFQTDISANLKDCKIYFEPIQEGSGDPSPDNVRPITGWDGVDIYHYGANLFPLTLPSTAFKGTFGTGSSSIGSAAKGRVWTMYVGENQNLYYQHGSISPTVTFAFSDKPLTTRTGAVIYNAVNCSSRNNVLLNSTTHPYLVIAIANSSLLVPETGGLDAASAMLSFGNTRKSYEKRTDPSSITIPFPQTIYGGYVDLVNGEVVEEWVKDVFVWENMTLSDSNNEYTRKHSRTTYYSASPYSTRQILNIGAKSNSNVLDSSHFYVLTNVLQLVLPTDTPNETEIEVSYKLATPIAHQLTTQVIKTIKGINNIWSDANGNIEVKFWKH